MKRGPVQIIEQITGILGQAVPGGLAEEVKENVQAALRSAFERLDLVTREEFEVQEAVLRRTREKLERLQAKLADLEKRLEEGQNKD